MDIKVTDMFEAKAIADQFDLVISVFDPPVAPTFNLGRDRHFIAKFWDTEHPNEKELIQMDIEVRSILGWIRTKDIKDNTRILVHCHAGVSRSSAIAWLILVQNGMDQIQAFQQLFKARPTIWPNKTVMAIGSQFLKLGPEFMKKVQEIDAEIASNRNEFLGYGG